MKMEKPNITIGMGFLAALSVVALVGAACGPAPTPIPTPTTTVYLPPQTLPATVTPYPTEEAEIIPTAAGERQLTHFATMREGQITEGSGAAFHPTWSPDGQQIAFDLTEEIEGLTRETIWVMRSDGSQAQRLFTPPISVMPGMWPGRPMGKGSPLAWVEWKGQISGYARPMARG
jgi:hypothetical protein